MDAGAKKVILTIDEVGPMGEGDTIYERSHYSFYKADGSVLDQGKYVYKHVHVAIQNAFPYLCGSHCMTTNTLFQP
jgi:hypothetical protein